MPGGEIIDLGLNGKNALVTGGERGIGRDVCLSLALEGVNIAYCDIKIEAGKDSTQAQIRTIGPSARAMQVDVSEKIKWLGLSRHRSINWEHRCLCEQRWDH
jgi:NAD(P)-dependent dehydrogenase (short-subunit alcohol dehydrogenase family)